MKSSSRCCPRNKGKLVGQKLPLKLEKIWAIRIRLEIAEKYHELAMFNMAIDCKLRSCDRRMGNRDLFWPATGEDSAGVAI